MHDDALAVFYIVKVGRNFCCMRWEVNNIGSCSSPTAILRAGKIKTPFHQTAIARDATTPKQLNLSFRPQHVISVYHSTLGDRRPQLYLI